MIDPRSWSSHLLGTARKRYKGTAASRASFAQEALAHFHSTASITPSSRYLARAMAKPLPLAKAEVVVEFGPGTGVMTRRLLELVPADARVLAFEINPQFVNYLQTEINDPRLEVVASGAETAGVELRRRGYRRIDAVLSSLGFGMMDESTGHKILQGLMPFLDERSVLTQFQYIHRMRFIEGKSNDKSKVEFFDLRVFLGGYFRTVRTTTVWRNLPPARVHACRL